MSAAGMPPSALNEGTLPPIQWSPVIAGAVTAAGISFTLLAFGTGIGLSVASNSPTWRDSSTWLWIVSGLWLVLVALCAFGFGGYVSGRMRGVLRAPAGPETEFRDGIHGLLTWGLAVLITALIGLAGVAAYSHTVASSNGPAGAFVAGESVIADDVDQLLRTARAPASDTVTAYRRAEISRLLLKANSRTGISPDEQNYLAQIAADRTGLSIAEAAARTERVIAAAGQDLHRARVAAVLQAFLIAAALLLGAAVAWFSAAEGGRDRRQGALPVWDWRFSRSRALIDSGP